MKLFFAAGAAVLLMFSLAGPSSEACDPGPKAIQEWKGYDVRHPQFRRITHLAVAPSGSVYLLDQELNLIREFSPDGAFLKTWELPDSEPLVALAAADSLLYLSDGHCTFQLFKDGSIATWHRGAASNGLATDQDGNVYLSASLSGLEYLESMKNSLRADYYEGLRDSLTRELGIWKLSSQGDPLKHWSGPPWPIALDHEGALFAVEPDSGNGFLSISKDKVEVRACRMGLVHGVTYRSLAISPEGHFMINNLNGVVEADGHGNVLRRWCDPGPNYDALKLPSSLSVDGRGHLYVADYANSRVLEFDLGTP